MVQKYKVFNNDREFTLLEKNKETSDETVLNWTAIFEKFKSESEQSDFSIEVYGLEEAWKNFTAKFKLIDAAGGIVRNEFNETLLIRRHGKWDLPKGKVEVGESVESAAVREVEEECGISDIKRGKLVLKTYHVYKGKKKWILKTTYWYEMVAPKQDVKPQVEEGITKVIWYSKNASKKVDLKNTYRSLIEVLSRI